MGGAYHQITHKIPYKSVGLVQSRSYHHFIELLTCSRHDIAEAINELALNNNHSILESWNSVHLYTDGYDMIKKYTKFKL